MIEWVECLSVGVTVLDDDHKVLIDLVNKYANAVSRGSVLEVHAVFRELEHYTHYHFKREEELMEQCGYESLDEHKHHHEKLAMQLKAYQEDFAWNAMSGSADEIKKFLQSWLFCHVMQEDFRYREAVGKLNLP